MPSPLSQRPLSNTKKNEAENKHRQSDDITDDREQIQSERAIAARPKDDVKQEWCAAESDNP